MIHFASGHSSSRQVDWLSETHQLFLCLPEFHELRKLIMWIPGHTEKQHAAVLCHAKHGLTRVLHCACVCVCVCEGEQVVMQGSLFACLCLWWTVVLPWRQNTQQWSVGSLLVCGPKIEVVPLSQLPSFIAVDSLEPSTARHRCLSLQTEARESCARLPASLHFKPVQTPDLSPPVSFRFVFVFFQVCRSCCSLRHTSLSLHFRFMSSC